MFCVLGNALGLPVKVVVVYEPPRGRCAAGATHAACLVDLTDGRTIMVDVLGFPSFWSMFFGMDDFVSPAFVFSQTFAPTGGRNEIKDGANPLGLHRRIAVRDQRGLLVLVYWSRAHAAEKKGEPDKAQGKPYREEPKKKLARKAKCLSDAAQPAEGGLVPLKYDVPHAPIICFSPHLPARATLEPYYSWRPQTPLMVPAGCSNLALKKKVTSSDSQPIIGELSQVTDGDKDGFEGSFVELAPGKQWVQIDLEKPADISAIVLWHFFVDRECAYHSVVVQISDDPKFCKGVMTVFNNDFANALGFGAGKQLEYVEDYRGKPIGVKDEKGAPVHGRYVRLYCKGSTSTDWNRYVEVEVYGKPVK